MDFKSIFLSGASVFHIIFGIITLNKVAIIIGMLAGLSTIIYNIKAYRSLKK